MWPELKYSTLILARLLVKKKKTRGQCSDIMGETDFIFGMQGNVYPCIVRI